MSQEAFKYWAFISYSHQDKAWGDWLHKALETYRVPKRLVGRASRDGTVPKRLFPIFRDREELPTSSDLGSNINEALKASRYLIVICSPKSAVSRWVNEEVKAFKALGREDRILCLIVDGEPNASDQPNSGLLECFPEAVRYRADAQGKLTQKRAEPIGADAREGKDGKVDTRLKLLAGLLGIAFDELKQREKQRQFWWRVQAATAGLVMLGVVGSVWWWQERQKAAEAVVALADRYMELGRQDYLRGEPITAVLFLAEAYRLDHARPNLRFLLRQAMSNIGTEVRTFQGDPTEAGLSTELIASPDLSRILMTFKDGSARIWETETSEQPLELGADNRVKTAAFSPDAKRIATAGADDGSVRIWDAATGKLLGTLAGHGLPVTKVFFSSDGQILAIGSKSGAVTLWNPQEGKLNRLLPADGEAVRPVMFSAVDHRLLAIGNESARLWDAKTGKLVAGVRLAKGFTNRKALLSPDAARVYTIDGNGVLEIWDAVRFKRTALIDIPRFIRGAWMTLGPDGKRLMTPDRDNSVAIWDAESAHNVGRLTGHYQWVTTAAYSADGRRIVTASEDQTARIWDARTQESLVWLVGHHSRVEKAACNPDCSRVVTLDYGGFAKLWEGKHATLSLEKAGAYQGYAKSVRLDASGQLIVVCSSDGFTRVWNAASGEQVLAREDSKGFEYGEPSRDGTLLLTVRRDRVAIWKLPGGQLTRSVDGLTGVLSANFSPDGAKVAIAGETGAGIWDVATGQKLLELTDSPNTRSAAAGPFDAQRGATLAYHAPNAVDAGMPGILPVSLQVNVRRIESANFSPDGKSILTVGIRTMLRDAATGAVIKTFDISGAHFGSFSVDGAHFVMADVTGEAVMWSVRSGKPVRTFSASNRPLVSAIISGDGSRIFAIADTGRLTVLDAHKGNVLAAFAAHGDQAIAAATDGLDRKLATVGSDGYLRVWDVSPESRTPQEIASALRCRISERFVNGTIVPGDPDPDCPGARERYGSREKLVR